MQLRKPFYCLVTLLAAVSVRAATHDVQISNYTFVPGTVRIQPGDTVRWTNMDSDGHTSTSGVNGNHNGIWDSGFISRNQSYVSPAFNTPGNFPYFCSPHPFMTGTVIVEAAQVNPPTVTITSPTNNTPLAAPGSITITATAQVVGSTISKVEFFNGSTSLGVDTQAPYTATANLTAGQHSLTAKATSAAGAEATSTAVTVTVSSGRTPLENPITKRIEMGDHTIELQTVAEGLVSPLGMAVPDDGSGRLFVFEQTGVIRIVRAEGLDPDPLLDMRSRLVQLSANHDERGLLGAVAHPNFKENPVIYTYSSEPVGPMADFMIMGITNNHQSVVAEWRIDPANTNRIDVNSRREIMRIDQPQFNHNGGAMHFGPDGFLYISLGDGGDADDQGAGHVPGGNAQDLNNILGKVIRIDPKGTNSANGKYGIPATNPFVGKDGLDEIYAYGFRNPFSMGFDKMTGELYVGDVGQNDIEELDRVFLGGNYGWPIKEGNFYFDQNGAGNGFVTAEPFSTIPPDLIDPIAEYDHDDGISIVGGFVYRGRAIPNLYGRYITGDLGNFGQNLGRLFYLDRSEFKEFRIGLTNRVLNNWLKGIGQDQDGELYVFGSEQIGPNGTTGKVLKIVPVPNTLTLTNITATDTTVQLAWSDGVGPFLVQSKQTLNAAMWQTVAVTADRSATVAAQSAAGYFRVSDMSGNPAIGFTVHMTGAAERPSVDTPATGTGTLSLEGNTLHFDIRYTGLKQTATTAHIHGPASAATSTNVLIPLDEFAVGGFGTSGILAGSKTLTPQQKAHILSGKTYVNIHTGAHPPGEIRGQIAPVLFGADLSGAAERPNPVNTAASGIGLFMLVGDQLTLNISYRDLSTVGVGAHIHGPATAATATNILVHLDVHTNAPFALNGNLNGTVTLTPQHLAWFIDGLTYVNIHSDQFKAGEIRGQILPMVGAIPLTASMSGAAESNPVDTPAKATALFALENDVLHFSASYEGLKELGVDAHIHGPAPVKVSTNVMIGLAHLNEGEFGTTGSIAGTVTTQPHQRQAILAGRTYFNIHSEAHRSGEIRGQLAPVVMQATLLGASERLTSVEKSGVGRATLLLVGDQLTVAATYSGLTVAANDAHIHGEGDTSVSAGVMVPLAPLNGGAFARQGGLMGTVPLTPQQLGALIEQRTYLNVHTLNNRPGEIRGQIIR